mgnify:FL=1
MHYKYDKEIKFMYLERKWLKEEGIEVEKYEREDEY